jgi:hypothetical protein
MVIFRCSVKILTRRARRKIRNGGRTLGPWRHKSTSIQHKVHLYTDPCIFAVESEWFGLRFQGSATMRMGPLTPSSSARIWHQNRSAFFVTRPTADCQRDFYIQMGG